MSRGPTTPTAGSSSTWTTSGPPCSPSSPPTAIDATNWRAEQAIRPCVVNRKVWGGNRTDGDAVTHGRVMTFPRTAHHQGTDAIAMLVDLTRASVPGVVAGLTLRPG